MKTVACIVARTNSTRLPQKVLRKISGKKMIEHIIERVKMVESIDDIYLCTSKNENDQILVEVAKNNGIKSYCGSENSVIDRMLDVAKITKADNLIRITGDNIFTEPYYLKEMIKYHKKNDADYTRTEYLPIGVTAEVMKVPALKDCYNKIDPEKSEYLFLYMFDPDSYNCVVLVPAEKNQKPFASLTVDTPNDLERTKFIFKNINKDFISYNNIINLSIEKNIPHFEIDRNMMIKLPDNKKMTYSEFRDDLEEKINKSLIVSLGD